MDAIFVYKFMEFTAFYKQPSSFLSIQGPVKLKAMKDSQK